ncbi:MAG: helix-turn-helix transcriptional regulator [Phycisphaeraceae bacterium]|nr:helix-turn-helix transcriptional regulator [Phycisphaerales bacterium]QOJ18319.1 MAG: helix-turn-helix transcriptional regulator [Phycisphaeraceae bacterium]
MRVERELMRGAGPVAVLKLLEQRAMYGYELIEQLDSQTQGVLAMGQSTLYPLLYNLEAKRLIAGSWREADSGRPRKYYALTAKGKKHLAGETRQWRQVAQAMTSLGVLTGTMEPGTVRSAAAAVPA